ncbi:MAG: hypothetical protein CMA24_02190, partial [Euryarchaeota archaeon]|nr:hypothetical protein [Euryarchaeota archaeon]
GWGHEGAENALYPGRAIEIAYADGCEECWIIGGSQIYEMFLDRVDEIHLTRVHTSQSGDVSFPPWNRDDWVENLIENVAENGDNEYNSTYSIWTRR